MPNRHKATGTTEETLLTRCEETKARLKKIKNQVIQLFRPGGANLENLRENLGLEN